MTSIYLKINCGYSRVAIRTISESAPCISHSKANKSNRQTQFQELFSDILKVKSDYFEGENGRQSLFDRHCNQILTAFGKIKNPEMRQKYLDTFSIANWKTLPQHSKTKHTLASCLECALVHTNLQQVFPGPTYQPMQSFTHEVASLSCDMSAKQLTRHVLCELQPVYENTYGMSFTKAVSQCKESGLQQTPTQSEKRKRKRSVQQECRDHIKKQMWKTDAMNVLAEGQSLKSYQRLRLCQAFETPDQKHIKTKRNPKRKHSPNFENVMWDKEKAATDLREWPIGTAINWSHFAKEHGIPGKNGGQVAKEFAKENGIDVFALDQRSANTRVRARKLRMPGGSVSIPAHSTIQEIQEDIGQMLEHGTLTLGEPCHPHKLVRYTTSGGVLIQREVMAYGRKIPLMTIREKILKKHERLMHLHTDEQIEKMEKNELLQFFENHQVQLPCVVTEDSLRKRLSQLERTRSLGMWHDHSTILGHGYVLITVRVMYDRAVFKVESELQKHKSFHNIQSFIEEPEIHLLAMSSSCAEDQAALIPDRLSCIRELATVIHTSTGIPITNRLVFFYGDKPAAQFERGTQQGGHYPCGTCACNVSRFDDLAHCLNSQWRSFEDLQQIATAGTCVHTLYMSTCTHTLHVMYVRDRIYTHMYICM